MEEKKIAIVTFQESNNYGALLQTYSLLLKVKQYCDAELINYDNPIINKGLRVVRFSKSKAGIYKGVMDFLNLYHRKKRVKCIKAFMSEKLTLSERMTYDEIEKKTDWSYDAFLSGSDQIWNINKIGGKVDGVYYLSAFKSECIKASYSSSMGNYDFENSKFNDNICENLKKLDYISTRERDVQIRLEHFLNREIEYVLDPVMLFDKLQWKQLVKGKEISIREPYMLVYTASYNPDLHKLASRIAKYKKIKLIKVGDGDLVCDWRYNKVYKSVDPLQFVSLFMNAEFILTNSFHGTAFAVNLDKKFISIAPNVTNRIESLLDSVDLRNRYYKSCSDVIVEENLFIDRTQTSIENLEKLRSRSLEYLEKIVR